jgi:hypothetical protein
MRPEWHRHRRTLDWLMTDKQADSALFTLSWA